jgi:hypothetical protein
MEELPTIGDILDALLDFRRVFMASFDRIEAHFEAIERRLGPLDTEICGGPSTSSG